MSGERARQDRRNEVEDYQQTVKALLAFAAFVVHDGTEERPDAHFGLGRRMTCSESNAVAEAGDEITPDLVAQKSKSFGVVVEAKKSLSRNQRFWHRHVEQLHKYDDQLTGWWTSDKRVPEHAAVLLIHQSRSRRFIRFLHDMLEEEPAVIGPRSLIVEFNHSAETASYYFFRAEHGEIRSEELRPQLRDGVQIPLDKVLSTYPNLRYCDAEPPVELLLTDLWTDVFPAMAADAEKDEDLGAFRLRVSVAAVTEELQKAYGSAALEGDRRSAEFPRQTWIRKALDRLVTHRSALPPEGESDEYEVHYRTVRGDVLDRMIKMEVGRGSAEERAEDQMPLFSESEEEDD